MGKNLSTFPFLRCPRPLQQMAAAWLDRDRLAGRKATLEVRNHTEGRGGPCVSQALSERAQCVDSWDRNPSVSSLQSSHCLFDDATFE